MLDREELQSAVDAGLLTPIQADALVAHYARTDEASADREEVRFARGFHDVFISIGLFILFIGLNWTSATIVPLREGPSLVVFYGVMCVITWLLAEWLTKRLRLALPSILLALAFVSYVALIFMATWNLRAGYGEEGTFLLMTSGNYELYLVGGIAALAAATAFYSRFRVPISLAWIVAGILITVLSIAETIRPGLVSLNLSLFTMLAGVACFASAMWYDSRDLKRITLNTDKAFWLHMLAAPLIVHSAISFLPASSLDNDGALPVIGIVFALSLVAIIVDRRALLVSALGYTGIALYTLLRLTNLSNQGIVAASLLILGLFVLTLGSGWTSVRRLVLAPFSGSWLFDYVPPIRTHEK